MRALERAVGVPLAVKVGRRAELTSAGMELARRAEEVLVALRAVENYFEGLAAHTVGKVRVGAIQSVSAALIPGAMAKVRAVYPDIEVVLSQAACPDSYRMVRAGEIDLALMCDLEIADGSQQIVVPDPAMIRIPLLADRRCILLPPEHPLAGQETILLKDLVNERWILESRHSRFLANCQELGFDPHVIATTDDQETIWNLVASGVGVAMMGGLGVVVPRNPDVAVRLLGDWPPRRVFALLWPDTIKVPAVAALIRALCSEAKAISPRRTTAPESAWGTAP